MLNFIDFFSNNHYDILLNSDLLKLDFFWTFLNYGISHFNHDIVENTLYLYIDIFKHETSKSNCNDFYEQSFSIIKVFLLFFLFLIRIFFLHFGQLF